MKPSTGSLQTHQIVSMAALALYAITLALTAFFPFATLFQIVYKTKTSELTIGLVLSEQRIDIGVTVITWLVLIGAIGFGIISYYCLIWNRRLELIGFISFITLSLFTSYIYFRVTSFYLIVRNKDDQVKARGFTDVEKSSVKMLVPILIFSISLLSWISSMAIIMYYKFLENSQNSSLQVLIITPIKPEDPEYNSVFGPSLSSVCGIPERKRRSSSLKSHTSRMSVYKNLGLDVVDADPVE